MLFRRKTKKHETLSDEVIEQKLKKSSDIRKQSEKDLHQARKDVSIINRIREENHIVIDLREVFGGH